MELLILAVILLALGLALHHSARNALCLARIKITDGRARLVRGRLPPRLWHEIEDVVQRNGDQSGEIRLDIERGRARVQAIRLREDTVQQVRNAAGQYPVAQLRRGAKRAVRSRAG